jgi:hypothetical protein
VGDSAGSGDPLDLTIAEPAHVQWGSDGLRVISPTLIASAGPATKLIEASKLSGEITIEAWITPLVQTTDRPATIAAIAGDAFHRNVLLEQGRWGGQDQDRYVARLRTSQHFDGVPPVRTPSGTVTQQRTHVVYTRDAAGVARLYIDGVAQVRHTRKGTLANWDAAFPLVLASDLGGESQPWAGTYHNLRISNRALSPAEVVRHFTEETAVFARLGAPARSSGAHIHLPLIR